MAISSSTLFHFTDSFDKLCGILESNFKPHYCIEQWGQFFTELSNNFLPFGIPMVCFCDIPLSQISEHVHDYGEYAIGLSKEWATKMKMGPVIYLTKGSIVSDHAIESLKKINNLLNKITQKETKKPDLPKDVLNYYQRFESLPISAE